jgi:hypothetical protein
LLKNLQTLKIRNMKIKLLIFFFICLQINGYSQRSDYFGVGTRYLTPIYDIFSLDDPGIEGIASSFTTFEGSVSILKWLRIGGFVNFNPENDGIINTALRIGINNLEFSYETGNLQGSLDNSLLSISDGGNIPVNVGEFSNDFKSFIIFITISDYSDYYLNQIGLGLTSMTAPTEATVQLENFANIDYIDPRTKINFYAFHQKIDMMNSRLSRIPSTDRIGVDFSSANIAGVVTLQASDFAKNELESGIRNGIGNDTSYANPNGFISSSRKPIWGVGISSDTRLGMAYTYKEEDKKLAFGIAGGYSFRAFFLMTAAISGKDPNGDEYFQSSPSGTFIYQHGPYLKAQVNW